MIKVYNSTFFANNITNYNTSIYQLIKQLSGNVFAEKNLIIYVSTGPVKNTYSSRVADPDPDLVGSGVFSSDPDPDTVLSFRIRQK